MKKDNDNGHNDITEKVTEVGFNLSLLSSLANFLEYGITDTYNFSNADISNLIVVMRRMIGTTQKEYEEIECNYGL